MTHVFKETDYAADLKAVQIDQYALTCIYHQTPELCLAAVRQNGKALDYIHDKAMFDHVVSNM